MTTLIEKLLRAFGAILLHTLIGAIALFALWQCRPAYAQPTDWHNNALSEQIRREAQCERKGGVYENGLCLQRNLTEAEEKRLLKLTLLLQAQREKSNGNK